MKAIGSPRYALAVLLAVNLLNFFDRQLPGSLGEPIRREFGLDAARAVLGHSSPAVTEVYAELDEAKAAEVMGRVG